jgi:hypothetical protein
MNFEKRFEIFYLLEIPKMKFKPEINFIIIKMTTTNKLLPTFEIN